VAGGFIGRDYLVYISSVLSHAPGIFSLVVTDSVSVATAVDLVAGQSATMAGAADGLVWSYTGSGAAFLVGAGASLHISQARLPRAHVDATAVGLVVPGCRT
jgi:hypothetical protein